MRRTAATLSAVLLALPCTAAPGEPLDASRDASPRPDCTESAHFADLAGGETTTLITSLQAPDLEQGYLVVVATDERGAPIAFDHLTGEAVLIDGVAGAALSMRPVNHRAVADRSVPTDLDGDGVQDLDGTEYERAADALLVPRFFRREREARDHLVLVALAGGRRFDTTLEILVHDETEAPVRFEHTFRCWDRVEIPGGPSGGSTGFPAALGNRSANDLAAGLLRIDGVEAVGDGVAIDDPAFYAVYAEDARESPSAAPPFELGLQPGHVPPDSPRGRLAVATEPGRSRDESIARGRPASLLLFPEFDHRAGSVTVVAVTNHAEDADVRARFAYVGVPAR